MRPLHEIVTIIPARGGSKGIPRKNLQPVGGVPLVRRAIASAIAADLGSVIVSTDDAEIADIATCAKADVHHRSSLTSSDEASTESVLLEVSRDLLSANTKVIVLVQCTSPFVEPIDIVRAAMHVYDRGGSAFCAAKFTRFVWSGEMAPSVVNHPPGARKRRQDLPPCFVEAGSVYAIDHAEFLQYKTRFVPAYKIVEIPEQRAMEIDTWEDLLLARHLSELLDPDPVGEVIFVDVDETLCITPISRDYSQAIPIPDAIMRVNSLARNNKIVIWTARGTEDRVDYSSLTKQQLETWGVRYNELLFGKPSFQRLYDDRARSFSPTHKALV